ncbi:MAG: hypothetical protein KBH78_01720 [Candidatus Hydrogenedentes bacterium]|nr:hypothetical protein [Candidatus Hydrogenedentota bacterium]
MIPERPSRGSQPVTPPSPQPGGSGVAHQVLDADAVCAQCGMVNPEGTLLCKNCGNNLRDQRMLRLQADEALQGRETAAEQRNTFLRNALGVLGVLVLLYLGLNASSLMNLLTSPQASTENVVTVTPHLYWEDQAKAAPFEALAKQVDTLPSEVEAQTARMNATITPLHTARYALFSTGINGEQYAGCASVRVQGQEVLFAAKLLNGLEIRGEVLNSEGLFYTPWDRSGVKMPDGSYQYGAGNGQQQADGGWMLWVQGTDWRGTALAYPME